MTWAQGNDAITTASPRLLSIGTEFLVNLGDGNDFLQHWIGEVGTSMVVDAGAGYDVVSVTNAHIQQDLVVRGGDDGDSLIVTDYSINGYALMDGQNGTDALIAHRCLMRRDGAIIGGQGADLLRADGGTFEASLLVDQGADFGQTELFRCSAQTIYLLGDGPHIADVQECRIRRLEGGLKGTNDAVRIYASVLDEIYLAFDSGDDLFEVSYSIVNTLASLAGGPGFDRFVNRQNQFATLQAFDFESIEVVSSWGV